MAVDNNECNEEFLQGPESIIKKGFLLCQCIRAETGHGLPSPGYSEKKVLVSAASEICGDTDTFHDCPLAPQESLCKENFQPEMGSGPQADVSCLHAFLMTLQVNSPTA